MAEFPSRIEKLFAQSSRNDSRIYGIIMCKNGQRQLVCVDNYIPTKAGRFAFSRSNGKEMWAVMLEKAWAKIHGSYERIEAGDTQTTLRDLTGAPGDTHDLKDKELD
jgi:calpain-15